jgi:hypothetical protein
MRCLGSRHASAEFIGIQHSSWSKAEHLKQSKGCSVPCPPSPVILTSYKLSALSFKLSAINYQLSAISYQLSAFSFQLSAFSFQLSAFSFHLPSITFSSQKQGLSASF